MTADVSSNEAQANVLMLAKKSGKTSDSGSAEVPGFQFA